MDFRDKYQAYRYYLDKIESRGLDVSDYREINYGVQFKVLFSGKQEVVRIYESKKKGVRLDASQIKSDELKDILSGQASSSINKKSKVDKLVFGGREKGNLKSDIESNCLIGTDESGKGDYFGPLVVVGVYAGSREKAILRELGVDDSKKISDPEILKLARDIKRLCKYDIITMDNLDYNSRYSSMQNLNKLLAWGHARVIENMLDKVDCSLVLVDQFGNKKLMEDALMEKGKNLVLEQRPRAEENIAVAAASIIARDGFIRKMDEMSEQFGMEFPKGASNIVKLVGRKFIARYGRESLAEVAKLHFKTTEEL